MIDKLLLLSMENFYHNIIGSNSENVEIYIGKSSGNQILKDIYKAEKEVLIVSPYVGEDKIDLLVELKDRGVDVKLAFSSLNDKQEYSTLKKLIVQHQRTNNDLKEKIKSRNKKLKIFYVFNIVISLIILGFVVIKTKSYFLKDVNLPNTEYQIFKFGLYSFFGLMLLNWYLKSKIKKNSKTQIYTYEYEERIRFKYLNKDFRKDKMFIHSKIYIIDDNIAYLGSVNFTHNGFKNNFETRIRITDKETIRKLKELVNNIFDGWNFKSNNLDWLSSRIYNEPKY